MNNLQIKTAADNVIVYGPIRITSTEVEFLVKNNGADTVADLGLYIRPASNLGSIDYPADAAPETDYQDLLTWGTEADLAIVATGGIIVVPNSDVPDPSVYVTRTAGAQVENKIPLGSLTASQSRYFKIVMEARPATPARRFYVDIVVE